MLQAVVRGTAPVDPPPALQRLEATGLVVRGPDGWAITDAGRIALGPELGPGSGSDLKTKIAAWFTT
jgi:hypothetical protein